MRIVLAALVAIAAGSSLYFSASEPAPRASETPIRHIAFEPVEVHGELPARVVFAPVTVVGRVRRPRALHAH